MSALLISILMACHDKKNFCDKYRAMDLLVLCSVEREVCRRACIGIRRREAALVRFLAACLPSKPEAMGPTLP